jgi:hypothetical protein
MRISGRRARVKQVRRAAAFAWEEERLGLAVTYSPSSGALKPTWRLGVGGGDISCRSAWKISVAGRAVRAFPRLSLELFEPLLDHGVGTGSAPQLHEGAHDRDVDALQPHSLVSSLDQGRRVAKAADRCLNRNSRSQSLNGSDSARVIAFSVRPRDRLRRIAIAAPTEPLTGPSNPQVGLNKPNACLLQRRGWDSNPRGSVNRPRDFQSRTLSRSVTSPGLPQG